MSMLPPEITAELGQLIQGLQSPDNSIRSQAEEVLANNWTSTRPEVLLMGLAEHIAGSQDAQVRSFAAVIFRRIASKTRKNEQGNVVDVFISLAKEQALVVRQKLLETLVNETDKQVRNKISDSVAEVGRQYSDNSTCPAGPPSRRAVCISPPALLNRKQTSHGRSCSQCSSS
jgi:importin-5